MLMFWSVGLLGLIALGAVLYYGAIVGGLYKDSMMAIFRQYGEEQKVYPLVRLALALGVFCLLLAFLVSGMLLRTSATALGVFAFICAYGISRVETLRTSMPRWYFSMLHESNRQERRAIAYAWLRLPFRTRLRLNGDGYAFRVFVDEIRLTVIYGARDPDDPWAAWQ